MLKSMRKNAKYFYFLFFLIILSFVFWGVGMNNNQRKPIATIDGHRLNSEDYYRAVDRMDETYRDAYGTKYDEKMRKDVRQQVLNGMIADYVLAQVAVKAGLTATDAEVKQVIMSDKNFQANGYFNRRAYEYVLRSYHLTPERYEASVRNEILLKKIRALIEDSVVASTDELKGISGDAKLAESLKSRLIEQKKQDALQSYVNGLLRTMDVTINKDELGS